MSAAAAGAVVPRRLQGKVAVITASTQGIGYGIALRLGTEGASVVISSRKQKNVDEALGRLKALGIDAIGLPCHVSIAEQRKRLIQTTVHPPWQSQPHHWLLVKRSLKHSPTFLHSWMVTAMMPCLPVCPSHRDLWDKTEKYGQIDILVSNAASNPSMDPIRNMSEAALDKLWEVNVKDGVLIVQEAAPHLSEGSSIVFISSARAYNLQEGIAMYGVTKTALLALTKGLAAELAPKVRVNCVAPGFVPTHFASFFIEDDSMRKEIESHVLLKRLGTTEDMAAAVAYLVSDDASYITGETIVVAGGMPSRL
ncbi:hypothetical protein O6H91_17G067200 [Diphasiastrum complanatum]|uniref:Uncharacterized protein n=1 Tax=Diphasiastrum complanatum TaxID=34168 RepID=A0ACC2B7Q1_DIPCM|nr:hypothetical protein O6H91_17G067200 [Diphasiastrum complanatum]